MDKSTLETYEFVPVNAESAGSNQFFVVQDDGTYLINRQVQYVTEVQDVKTVLDGVQSCTVYDVSEQPFYVDVDNSSELMSVSDQFVLPDASSNLYANSYLLQAGTSSNQIEDVTESQFKPNPSIGLDLGVNTKPVNNCTEITLNDEQYRKLEQKGWLLIELNDKVFVLDTLGGLRDVTSNTQLIQKLKSEDQADFNWNKDLQCIKIENQSSPMEVEPNSSPQPNLMEFAVATTHNANIGQLPLVINDPSRGNLRQETLVNRRIDTVNNLECTIQSANETTNSLPQSADPCRDVNVFFVKSEKSDENTAKEKSIIRIKTKLSLKDIPDKIVLGKTPKGKTLVARVKRTKAPSEESTIETYLDPEQNGQPIDTSFDPEEMQFSDLIKQAIRCTEKQITAKDLQTIEMIIEQLTQGVAPFDASIQVNDCLFITKIIKKTDNQGNVIFKSRPMIWTGCVQAENNQFKFIHYPNILQTLLFSEDHSMISSTVVHIQILEEIRRGTNVVKTSVTVHKKQLTPGRPKKMDMVYACSACATVFDSEEELLLHRERCLESVDTNEFLKIDKTKSIRCIMSGKEKHYECMQCNHKFNRLSTCKKHMRTHYHLSMKPSINNVEVKNDTENTPTSKVYKCNMCPSVYLHSSTLSKHILSSHIKMATQNGN
ncbi:uncharacterized protein LOC128675308 [Plodia interpunctella]|uniref:uncharacterized protein LOC128675308 n=1 Tax=Plodia interpunctella TaxID=58824 RepID=UPI002367A072|nr:uncharacterized protein LOC128675308 [Plodia interpunctella]